MQREIIFRGKRVDSGGWVYGSYMEYHPHHFANGNSTIVEGGCVYCEVIPKAVGQFTGITDKNGIQIYEGDIVSGATFNGSYANGEVVFMDGGYFIVPNREIEGIADLHLSVYYIEVIGNIHDNPELLKP